MRQGWEVDMDVDVDVNLNVNADGESVSSREGGGEGEGEGEVGMRALSSAWRTQWKMAPGRASAFVERGGEMCSNR